MMITNELYLKTYFDIQSDDYLEKYKSYQTGDRFKFNVWALLFGVFWFLYRKLWFEALVIFLIYGVIYLLEIGMVEFFSVDPDIQWLIYSIFDVIFAITLGFFGYNFYLRKSERKINQVISRESNEKERLRLLKKIGGISRAPYYLLSLIILLLIVLNARPF